MNFLHNLLQDRSGMIGTNNLLINKKGFSQLNPFLLYNFHQYHFTVVPFSLSTSQLFTF